MKKNFNQKKIAKTLRPNIPGYGCAARPKIDGSCWAARPSTFLKWFGSG